MGGENRRKRLMGCLRLIAALFVMINHGIYLRYLPPDFLGYSYSTLNLRLFFFFLLSGFLITYLIREKIPRVKYWPLQFYLGRAARLMPAYWLALIVSVLFIAWYGTNPFHYRRFPVGVDGLGDTLQNVFLLVPGSFALWHFTLPLPTDRILLMPQAWALVMEWGFLLLAPLLALRPGAALIGLGLSLGFWIGAYPKLRGAEGYFAFSSMFFFLGTLAYHAYERWLKDRQATNMQLGAGVFLGGLLAFYFYFVRDIKAALGTAQTLALFCTLTLAAIVLLFHTARHIYWDRFIGDLAYPVFLFHPLLMAFLFKQGLSPDEIGLFSIPLCLCLALIVILIIDRPIGQWRKERRKILHRSN